MTETPIPIRLDYPIATRSGLKDITILSSSAQRPFCIVALVNMGFRLDAVIRYDEFGRAEVDNRSLDLVNLETGPVTAWVGMYFWHGVPLFTIRDTYQQAAQWVDGHPLATVSSLLLHPGEGLLDEPQKKDPA